MNSFSRSSPCPICAGYANLIRDRGERCHGFLSDDRKYAHCSRQEHAGSLVIDSGSGTYAHFLFGQCRCGARHNGERHPKGGRRQHHLTDLGNARRMIEQHGRDLSFCHIWKKWLVWDGARWTADTSGEVERRAKHTVLTIYEEAAAEQDEAKRKALAKWAASSESRSRISAMVDLAKTESGVTLVPERLDGEPWLLNC